MGLRELSGPLLIRCSIPSLLQGPARFKNFIRSDRIIHEKHASLPVICPDYNRNRAVVNPLQEGAGHEEPESGDSDGKSLSPPSGNTSSGAAHYLPLKGKAMRQMTHAALML